MKTITTAILFFGSVLPLFSQRYLTDVYPVLDSVIGSTYGTALNYQAVNQNLLYDFYSPKNDTAQKRPLIIYIHGGGFTTGSRTYPSVQILCRRMARKGYAVANLDYRLDPNFNIYNSNTDRRAMTDAMQDAKQAIRYFKANASSFKLDTNKIFIGGESAGAITSMMAGFVDKQIEMVPYPMANPNDPVGSTTNSNVGNDVHGVLCLCGLILDTLAMETASDPPILWTHGSADPLIPIGLAFNIVLRAFHIGLPIQAKVYEGATHCPWYDGNPNWPVYMDSTITDITTFLYPQVVTSVAGNEYSENKLEKPIFPNPAGNKITINLNKEYQAVEVVILNQLGEEIVRNSYRKIKTIEQNTSGLRNGMYYIKIRVDETETFTEKLVLIKE